MEKTEYCHFDKYLLPNADIDGECSLLADFEGFLQGE